MTQCNRAPRQQFQALTNITLIIKQLAVPDQWQAAAKGARLS